MTITTDLAPEHPIYVAPPTIIWQVCELVNCLCGMLEAEGAGPTCWCGAVPGGAVSWDYCGECSGGNCGMGYVRPAGIFPYTEFPIPQTDVHCVSPLAWVVEVGALRCMPTSQDGSPLNSNESLEITVATMLDARAIYKAIKCCEALKGVAIQQYNPVGPAGGCVGGFWLAYLDVPDI